ncbi:biotin-dependent carboxyltransferase family protein [Coralliovum pocilloporae]|uniref:5-oxoprolinase subunit C family protein n=1 Tax=Coralliovum pocilloporae TaxID=3066369 RepID=UPI003306B70E
MNPVLRVLSAGPAVSVQDLGRPGYQRYGVTEGGVVDAFAYREGSALLGQASELAVLEFYGLGGRFQAEYGAVDVALTGACFRASVDGTPVVWRSAFRLEEGQVLDIGGASGGAYGYLSVAGGFDVPMAMGARATHVKAGFGGYQGRMLQAGDCLKIGDGPARSKLGEALPEPGYFGRSVIRILWGAQAHYYSEDERARFLATEFQVSSKRDRMGVRLDFAADPFNTEMALSGTSDAISLGDIQIPGDGFPAVLLADRQPTGGYPRIATVIGADLNALAQLPSGSRFRFQLVDEETALGCLSRFRAELERLPSLSTPLLRDPSEMDDLLSYQLISGAVADGDMLPWDRD